MGDYIINVVEARLGKRFLRYGGLLVNLDNKTVILRPLLTYDKIEIIKIAKKIGTFETSILPFADCCALFVPKAPVTKPRIHIAEKLESEFDFLSKIYEVTIDKYIKIID